MTRNRVLAQLKREGVMLESSHGPVPNLVELIAGEPVRGNLVRLANLFPKTGSQRFKKSIRGRGELGIRTGVHRHPSWAARGSLRSVAQHDAQERVVDLQAAVVVDEPELAKLVHEEVDPRACRANHLGQDFLRDFRKGAVSRLRFTVTREQQKRARKALFAGIEQLIDQVFFDSNVPRQHVSKEPIRKRGLGMEPSHHFLLLDGQDHARLHGRRGCHTLRLACKATLAKEMARLEHSNYGFFARVRHDGQPDDALLEIHDGRGRIALSKDHRPASELDTLRAYARPIQVRQRI